MDEMGTVLFILFTSVFLEIFLYIAWMVFNKLQRKKRKGEKGEKRAQKSQRMEETKDGL